MVLTSHGTCRSSGKKSLSPVAARVPQDPRAPIQGAAPEVRQGEGLEAPVLGRPQPAVSHGPLVLPQQEQDGEHLDLGLDWLLTTSETSWAEYNYLNTSSEHRATTLGMRRKLSVK